MVRKISILVLLFLPNFAWSEAIMSSLRPIARPVTQLTTQELAPPKPMARPVIDQAIVAKGSALRPRAKPVFAKISAVQSIERSPRPERRPDLQNISAKVGQTAPVKTPKQTLKGSVCGNRAIKGEMIAPIRSSVKGCGIAEPVRVTEINGLRLSPAATLNCGAAEALETWIAKSVLPAFAPRQVVQLQIAASYSCRGRNNVKGARISEHGRGNAVDIAGLTLADGTSLSVANNYDKTLRKVHKGACGIFGTTLGPGSDGYHENHIHLDIARYRSGSYCR